MAAAEISWPGVHYRRDIGAQALLVIPRYSLPEIADLFTDEARFGAWLEVEILAVEAWAELGVIPKRRTRLRVRVRDFDVAEIHEREKVTEHDVAAFVDVVQETRRHAGRCVGALRAHVERRRRHCPRAADDARARPASSARRPTLEDAIAKRAREFRDTPMVGRTHGIHAEPTTFGAKLALWAMQVRRDRDRLARARDT